MNDITDIRRQADAGSTEQQWLTYLYYRMNNQPGRAERYRRRAQNCWQSQIITGTTSAADCASEIHRECEQNDLSALHFSAVCKALGKDETSARALWQRAADNGCKRAQDVLSITESCTEQAPEVLAADPPVTLYRGFMSPLLCRWITHTALPHLQPSLTWDPNSGRHIENPVRTSESMTFMPWLVETGLIQIQRAIAAHAAMPFGQCESVGVLRYRPGQQYRAHFDGFAIGEPGTQQMLEDGGQRIRTALVYLNDDYGGGATRLEELDLEVKGNTGDLLVFVDIDDQGQRHPGSLHSGMAVQHGEKWLLTQWYRERATHYTQALHP